MSSQLTAAVIDVTIFKLVFDPLRYHGQQDGRSNGRSGQYHLQPPHAKRTVAQSNAGPTDTEHSNVQVPGSVLLIRERATGLLKNFRFAMF